MIKYLKLSVLNILVVTLVGSVIWTIMEYRSGSGINLLISGFIIVVIILILVFQKLECLSKICGLIKILEH